MIIELDVLLYYLDPRFFAFVYLLDRLNRYSLAHEDLLRARTAWLQELDGIELAGFWQRAAALLIDGLIVGIVYSILLSTVVTIYVHRHPNSTIAINLGDATHKIREQRETESGVRSVQEEAHQKLREEGIYLVQVISCQSSISESASGKGTGAAPASAS